jgi:hypothetical protein
VRKFSFLPVCALLLVMSIHSIRSCSGTALTASHSSRLSREIFWGLRKEWDSYAHKHIKFPADMLKTILRKIVVVVPCYG